MATLSESRRLIANHVQKAKTMSDLFPLQSVLYDVNKEKARVSDLLSQATSEEVMRICMNSVSMVEIFCDDIITLILEFVERAGIDGSYANLVCGSFKKASSRNKRKQERMRNEAIQKVFKKGKEWLVRNGESVMNVIRNKMQSGDTLRLAAGEYTIKSETGFSVFEQKSIQIIGAGPMESVVWLWCDVNEISKPTHWKGVSVYLAATECNVYDRLWLTNCHFGVEQYMMYFYGADDLDCKDVEFEGTQADEDQPEYDEVGIRYEHNIWENSNFNRPILRNCRFFDCDRPM